MGVCASAPSGAALTLPLLGPSAQSSTNFCRDDMACFWICGSGPSTHPCTNTLSRPSMEPRLLGATSVLASPLCTIPCTNEWKKRSRSTRSRSSSERGAPGGSEPGSGAPIDSSSLPLIVGSSSTTCEWNLALNLATSWLTRVTTSCSSTPSAPCSNPGTAARANGRTLSPRHSTMRCSSISTRPRSSDERGNTAAVCRDASSAASKTCETACACAWVKPFESVPSAPTMWAARAVRASAAVATESAPSSSPPPISPPAACAAALGPVPPASLMACSCSARTCASW
mmetsp:Transcript_2145/g.5501  ORF Transcript_2145/g.5501 Transcript_2145/m.5501 type:complete len:286 (-) Transcript_2145:275-1132(-)